MGWVNKKNYSAVVILLLSVLFLTGIYLLNTKMFSISANYTAHILDHVTLTINKVEKTYETGEAVNLVSGDTVTFKSGKGYATIEGGEETIVLSDKSKVRSVVLPFVKEHANIQKIPPLFYESISKNITRSIEFIYSKAIRVDGEKEIVIASENWVKDSSSLPILFELISPEEKVETTFLNNQKKVARFVIPARILCPKHGYTLKISNNRKQTLLKSLIITDCKGIVL